MRKKTLLWLSGILLSTCMAFAQEIPVELITAFRKGSSTELSRFLNDKVDLVIQNRKQNADKKTATATLATFFEQNKVSNFSINHQGKRDESSFIIGTLNTANGNYRVNCFFKKLPQGTLIHQIRIDKTNE
ncbi:DUF4783 domain-containing protein [Bacteroides sp. 224]|uniref:DUF4783 domain-containing protein n=1 Tax=Bacteroides sp. 224 TaxID=2302936 RepID=UPI0013CF7A2F|nr:DUF4783 domain-containing protein [Bacteroides sp. 224]NDV66627.1 DUF4783 domain-containing protein [Bacteroides sp. 224]